MCGTAKEVNSKKFEYQLQWAAIDSGSLMCGVKKKKKYFNELMVVIVIYCVGYIILLCYLYYFNVLNIKIKSLMLGVL